VVLGLVLLNSKSFLMPLEREATTQAEPFLFQEGERRFGRI
jgi:hypothetical protein